MITATAKSNAKLDATTVKPKVAAAPHKLRATVVETPEPAQPDDTKSFSDMFKEFVNGSDLPSGKRIIVALAANLVLTGTLGYLGIALTSYLVVGASVLTGSAFLVFMVAFIGYAITLIASMMAGSKLQSAILDGSLERGFASARSKVSGWFSRATESVARATEGVAA